MGDGAISFVVRTGRLTVGAHHRLVFQQLIGKDALKLALGELLVALEAVAEGSGKGVTLNLPELGHLNFGGVEFQGGTH